MKVLEEAFAKLDVHIVHKFDAVAVVALRRTFLRQLANPTIAPSHSVALNQSFPTSTHDAREGHFAGFSLEMEELLERYHAK